MSKVAWFLGGTVVGAVGLAAAAYFLSDDDEWEDSPSVDSSEQDNPIECSVEDDDAENMAFPDNVQDSDKKKSKKSRDSQEAEDSFDASWVDATTA